MDEIMIVRLNLSEWEDYKNLRLKALKDNPEAFGQTLEEVSLRTEEKWKMLLEKSDDDRKRWVFFARLNGILVGMVSGQAMESVKGGVKIREMFVSAQARGKSIAKKLMEHLTGELLKNTDRRVLRVGVFKTQTQAINLCKSLGFKILEEKTEVFSNGASHESLIMELKLEQS